MKKPSRRPSLFERVKKGLEEAIQFARGEISIRTFEIEEPPPSVNATDEVPMHEKHNPPKNSKRAEE
jgi:hypothetical protein